jgi:multidrug transporter EmrE-like cation transporter
MMRNLLVVGLIAAYVFCAVVANVGFKKSAMSGGWQGFLQWQVVGNLAGFLSVLALTMLLRYLPLHTAYAVTLGLAFVAVEVGAAWFLFREAVTPIQWLGSGLIGAGIVVVSLGK